MTSKHILFTGAPVWSHIRPFCILAARLVKQRPDVSLTLVLSPQVLKKTDEELSVELGEGDLADVRKRIRVFSSIASASANPMEGIQQMAEAYSNVYGLLVAGKPVTCQATGTLFEPLPPPTVVILDFICAVEYNVMRQLSGISIPIVGWMMGHAPSIIRIFGPEAMGGYGDLGAKVDVEAARLGVTAEEVGDKIYQETTGKVIKLPGIPEMYDWEFFPQLQLFEGTATPFLRLVPPLLRGYNAILASNTQSWEGDGIDAIREWLSEWNKEVYAVGPLLPSGYGTLQQSNRGVNNLEVFLNSMQAKYGDKSVVLFSLGTLFWPKDNRYLEEIIDAFIENSIPLVLSCPSPFAKLHDSDEVKKKLEASGIGFFMTWCPQQYVLSHPATGWFFTHGGHNSVTESLGSGIPMIVWPFGADQPATALHLSSLGIGIELLEVRTGIHASKPLRRNGKSAVGTREAVGKEIREVINLCKSHQGTEMREKAQSMKRKFQKAWEVDGEATKALNLFLGRFVAR